MKKNLNIAYLNGADIGKKIINVVETINNQDKNIDITENGVVEVVADDDYSGLGKVKVNVDVPIEPDVIMTINDQVRFIDCDGTILYTYTMDEIKSMNELPPLPTKEGLICQGWNYTLEDILEQDYFCEVGAVYTTDNGETRCYISVTDESDNIMHINMRVTGTVSVDWGDGNIEEVTGYLNLTHEYSLGDYIIKLLSIDDSTIESTATYGLFVEDNHSSRNNITTKIHLGDNITSIKQIGNCTLLKELTISNNIIFNNSRIKAGYIKAIIIPKGNTIFGGASGFDNNSAVSLPNTITTVWVGIQISNINRAVYPKSVTKFSNYTGDTALFFSKFSYSSQYPTTILEGTYVYTGTYSLVCKYIICKNGYIDNDLDFSNYEPIAVDIINNKLYKVNNLKINIDNRRIRLGNYFNTIIVEDSVTNLPENAFENCNMKNVRLSNNLSTITKYCFAYCKCLENVELPNGIVEIKNLAFYYCMMLQNINLNEGLESIGNNAFSYCDKLKKVLMPSTIKNIGSSAFNYTDIVDFTKHNEIPIISSNTFYNDTKIIVPDNLYNEWIAATNWASYASNIIKKSDYETLIN